MLHALRTLIHTLHSRTVPAFHVTQLIGSGQRRTLHLDHVPGQGYTVYETYVDPTEWAERIDAETWETTHCRHEAFAIFRDSGASPDALQAAQAHTSCTVLVPERAQLEFIFSDGTCQMVDVLQHLTAQSLIKEIGHCGQPQAVRAWSADHEVTWQAVFDRRAWGAEVRMVVHRLLAS